MVEAAPKPETFRVKKRARPVARPVRTRARTARPAAPQAPQPRPATQAPPPTGPEVIRTERLTKYYGSLRALHSVNFTVGRGEVFGFLGPNGAGKTTFTKLLMGFARPTAGGVRLFGHDPRRDPAKTHGRVGIIPDQFGFYANLTGRANLDFYARLYGIPASRRATRVQELLDQVGLADRARSRVRTYSHGMRQRLVIAQALLPDPDLIVFDEPTTGLDPRGAYEVRQLIKDLASRGKTVFLSSHILSEVEEVCTRVGILNKGVLLKVSGVEDLRKEFRGGVATILVRVEEASNKVLAALSGVQGVEGVKEEDGVLRVESRQPHLAPDVAAAIVKAGGRITYLAEEKVPLEEMFLALTEERK